MQLTVVIPAYNAEQSIGAVINEINRQTSEDCEIIVVDDGSTDATASHAVGPNVRCIKQKNQGPAAARNNGAHEAKGDILLFLDSDLVPSEGLVERITAPFADSDIAAVQGTMITRQKEVIPRYCQAEIEYKQRKCRRHKYIDSIAAGIFAIRRCIYLEYGGFCTQFRMAAAEDTDLSFRMHADGLKILFRPDALVYHPQPPTLRSYVRLKFWRGYWRALLYRRHPAKVVNDSYTSHLQKIQVASAAFAPVWLPLTVLLLGWLGLMWVAVPMTLTTFPSSLAIIREHGLRCGAIAPCMQFLAAWSLGSGLVLGTINEVLRLRPLRAEQM